MADASVASGAFRARTYIRSPDIDRDRSTVVACFVFARAAARGRTNRLVVIGYGRGVRRRRVCRGTAIAVCRAARTFRV